MQTTIILLLCLLSVAVSAAVAWILGRLVAWSVAVEDRDARFDGFFGIAILSVLVLCAPAFTMMIALAGDISLDDITESSATFVIVAWSIHYEFLRRCFLKGKRSSKHYRASP